MQKKKKRAGESIEVARREKRVCGNSERTKAWVSLQKFRGFSLKQ